MYKIPKYLAPRDNIPVKNKCYIINDCNNIFFVLYYICVNKAKIIIRNLESETGWNYNIYFKIHDNENEEIFTIFPQEENVFYSIINLEKVKLEPVEFKNQKIPKRIVQTFWSDYAQSLIHYNTILSLIELNPEYEYVFYNDIMCRDLIKNNFPKNVLTAYDMLSTGTYRADMFRACYIYLYGGCYFDCKLINKTPIREFIDSNDELLLSTDGLENTPDGEFHRGYFNGMFMSVPKNPCLLNVINKTTMNILNKSYRFADTFGPHIFYDAINEQNTFFNVKFRCNYPVVYDIATNKILISGLNKDYYNKLKDQYYRDLWKNKKLYYEIVHIDKYVIKYEPQNYKFNFFIDKEFLIVRCIDNNSCDFNLTIKLVNNDTNIEKKIIIKSSNEKIKLD
ncbi:MAG: glycosyltransferase [Candidatus Micrarchaeaceae archaeon]